MRRADQCKKKDSSCVARAKDFLAYSAPQARGWKELCETLPRGTEATDGWVAAQCATRGRSDDRCLYVTRGSWSVPLAGVKESDLTREYEGRSIRVRWSRHSSS